VDDVDEPQAHAHPTIIPTRVNVDRIALPSFRFLVNQLSISQFTARAPGAGTRKILDRETPAG
jgi:hypothetical protein